MRKIYWELTRIMWKGPSSLNPLLMANLRPCIGADKSRFWPNRALWGTSMKLGRIVV